MMGGPFCRGGICERYPCRSTPQHARKEGKEWAGREGAWGRAARDTTHTHTHPGSRSWAGRSDRTSSRARREASSTGLTRARPHLTSSVVAAANRGGFAAQCSAPLPGRCSRQAQQPRRETHRRRSRPQTPRAPGNPPCTVAVPRCRQSPSRTASPPASGS